MSKTKFSCFAITYNVHLKPISIRILALITEAANDIYENCDGIEYELASTRLDLRFVPDETEFDDEPKQVATEFPMLSNYQPTVYVFLPLVIYSSFKACNSPLFNFIVHFLMPFNSLVWFIFLTVAL